MRKAPLGILAGTAIAAVLATAGAHASPFSNPSFEVRVPMPEPANVAPPTARDAAPVRSVAPQPQPDAFRAPPSQPTTRARATARPEADTPAVAAPLPAPASRQRVATPGPSPLPEPAAEPIARIPVPAPAPAAPRPAAVPVPAAAPSVAVPVPAAPAAATQTVADSAVTERLRDLIGDKARIERLVTRQNERDAIVGFYQKRQFAPLWTENGGAAARLRAAATHLGGVDADALDPSEYPVPNFAGDADALAEAELRFTATLLTYARHATDGRVHWSRVAPDIFYPSSFNPADVLNRIGSAPDLGRTLAGLNPPHAGYRALRAKYQEMRQQPDDAGPQRIAAGPVLRIVKDRQGRDQMPSDARVPLVRERLRVAAEPNTTYNRSLANAVARFQKARGIRPTGNLDAATIAALNPPSRAQQLDTIRVNLERWRWLPRDFGRLHVALNIPDYNLRVMNNGQQVWTTRVVVGKPSQPTPLISDTMKYITVNPIWHPPQSIIYQELMPRYEAGDRNVFERQGLKVERRQNGEIRVFQPPGDRNALGRLRFNFPNKFLVYMHDTPEKYYFSHERRAYSHGCMRVQDPLKYAEVLLSLGAPRGNFTQENIRRMYGDQERQIDFQVPVQVHLTYQTALVDESGRLQFREDIYDHDKRLLSHLTGPERRVADTLMERPADPNYQPKAEERQRLNNLARNSAGPNPFALFEQLFR